MVPTHAFGTKRLCLCPPRFGFGFSIGDHIVAMITLRVLVEERLKTMELLRVEIVPARDMHLGIA